ncbi:CG11158 [Drosophila busckii]|uniref:CG11158 n=1 Tax=Drosophila busckii TaxID=30019 RepID=A0A0M4EKB6_DROBS|nr:inosine-uridine preferring nucleoside hydrolase [Drosophila busckii]ALC49804.1 CG11158 [Drosophila busckii]
MEKSVRRVVFDCDIGIDDAWGLLMLLRAEEYLKSFKCEIPESIPIQKFKLTAVTCVRGNADIENTTKNAMRVLSAVKRMDIPVYKGCSGPILPTNWKPYSDFHGKDGLGDVGDYPQINEEQQLCSEHAVNAMYRLACEFPGQIDYILIGPLTNFAMCINLYGDAFLDKIGNVYIMGGNIHGKGNATKSAEFNFMLDPEAAFIVLERLKQPALILPWETCIDEELDLTLDWRLNVLGAVNSDFIKLMNRVETNVFVPRGFVKWLTCDALLIAAYLFPSHVIAQQRGYYASVELSGTQTRGQMVLDHKKGRIVDYLHGKDINANLIYHLHAKHMRTIFAWAAGLEGVRIEQLWEEEK